MRARVAQAGELRRPAVKPAPALALGQRSEGAQKLAAQWL